MDLVGLQIFTWALVYVYDFLPVDRQGFRDNLPKSLPVEEIIFKKKEEQDMEKPRLTSSIVPL